MNISKFFQLGMGLAFMAFMSTAVSNQTQAQTCGAVGAGEYPFTVHGGYTCAVNVTVNYTGGSLTCTTGALPYTMGIPVGSTITSILVNGFVAPIMPAPGANVTGPCAGSCGAACMHIHGDLSPGNESVHVN